VARGRGESDEPGRDAGQLSLEARFFVPRASATPPALEPPPDLWDRAAPPDDERAPGPAAPARGDQAKREARVLTVGELVRGARITLEARFADIRVEGELSGFKRSGPGHLYFCLKDGEAQVDCVMFSREASRVKVPLGDGQLVRCRGRLTIFEGRGKFQLSVTAIEPAGAGALAAAFAALKEKLAAEGLFEAARKRPLPFLPRRIGVVTSPSGAVFRDIIRVAHRRFPVPILLAPTPVQGEGAARAIIAALRQIATVRDVDVIILARGGGALEDLFCFNDEALARAIAACRVPVISAVGHETDFTIADFVADLRAPTPSAAAELAVPVAVELLDELQVLGRRLGRAVSAELRTCRLHLERARSRLGDPRRMVDGQRQGLDELAARAAELLRALVQRRRALLRAQEARLFRAHPQRRIGDQRAALAGLERRLGAALVARQRRLGEQRAALVALERRLGAAVTARVTARRRALEGLAGKLHSLSPLAVLERGYSLTRRADGRVVTKAEGLATGDVLHVAFRDGEVATRVEAIEEKKQP
jgi:exodeoxyribonuclease VII large subunit